MTVKRKILMVLLGLILFLHILPFLIPLSTASQITDTPFENSRRLRIDGVELHYRTWIPDEAEHNPIVYIHGLGGSTFSWRNNIDEFVEEGYPVIAVDLPAFGYSSRQTGLIHSQENRSKWIFELLDYLHTTDIIHPGEGYHLVGHSMGGGVIAAMALDRPEDIQTLIFVAGSVLDNPPRVRSLLSYPPLKRTVSVLGEHVFFSKDRLEGILSSAYGEEVDEATLEGYLHPFNIPGTGRAWGDLLSTSTAFSEEAVASISVPAMLIWGEEDSWVSLEEGARLENLLSKGDLTIIEGSAHTPMETDSAEFNDRLLEFLSGRDD
jgi:pimeloyl-ACP methyl ester carboxylesterase